MSGNEKTLDTFPPSLILITSSIWFLLQLEARSRLIFAQTCYSEPLPQFNQANRVVYPEHSTMECVAPLLIKYVPE